MTTITYSDTTKDLLSLLKQDDHYSSAVLDLLEEGNSKYLADLKLNFKNSFDSELLNAKELALLGVALAVNAGNDVLRVYFEKLSGETGASKEEVAEAAACASLLSANNVLYRFRHFTGKEKYQQIQARIKMNIMMKPVTGKEFFELMSLAVSAVNGCEMCVNAHEDSLIKLGASEERIFEAIRFSSVLMSLSKVVR